MGTVEGDLTEPSALEECSCGLMFLTESKGKQATACSFFGVYIASSKNSRTERILDSYANPRLRLCLKFSQSSSLDEAMCKNGKSAPLLKR